MKKMLNNKGMSTGKKIALVTGIAATIGAYALLGPNGKKNQKKVKVLVAKISKTEKKLKADFKKIKAKAGPSLKEFKKTIKRVSATVKKEIKKV